MKVGGYVVASERLGIALNERTLKDRQFYQQRGVIPDLKTADTDGFLTLGRRVFEFFFKGTFRSEAHAVVLYA